MLTPSVPRDSTDTPKFKILENTRIYTDLCANTYILTKHTHTHVKYNYVRIKKRSFDILAPYKLAYYYYYYYYYYYKILILHDCFSCFYPHCIVILKENFFY